ncbi:2-dehydropantoate 2-reductase [Halobacillus kuroshimensis]|uniref:2-dehydropantoate 2-reductase n=1 Tax=Halobacillus kuroshimensis TaxID=302481 RepID=A0ABS3DSL7_9BACI|nr:2-dehydropantoate 2-reductase [Halobacillus kuroshimensis]MBN8234342.1 2-dehydropantoate 2-reductase [Halobacillus kuroshimensis]
MRVGVIGGGAVGLLAGAYLGRTHDVHMVVRNEEQKDILCREGIWCDAFSAAVFVEAHLYPRLPRDMDVWLVSVKQYDLEEVLSLPLPENGKYLFLQNGMSHLDQLQSLYLDTFAAVVEHGALKVSFNEVAHTGKGRIKAAPFTGSLPDMEELAESLHQEDFPFLVHADAVGMLSEKLVVNAVINPLTALFEQKNRAVKDNPYIRSLGYRLCEEACRTLSLDVQHQWNRVLAIAEQTGGNQSSMWKDLQEGRRTEIDAISGFILDRAREDLPVHQFIVEAVHAMEYEKGVIVDE